MSRLSYQEEKLYTDFFYQVDKSDGSGNGRLSLENCEKVLDLCGYRLPRSVVKNFIQPEPGDKWEISLEDFLTSLYTVAPKKSPNHKAAELRRLFQAHDLNKDGHVSFHELRTNMPPSVSGEEIRDFIRDWDKDGDWKLSFDEFVSMYTASSPSDDTGGDAGSQKTQIN